jgi:soluble lytic murein transglycosylase-like protein
MQIRLDTASAYCQIRDIISLEPDAINIDCGVRYLRLMLDRFFYQGGIPDAVSAYNAGPGNVRPGGPSDVGGLVYINLGYIRRVLGMVARFRLLFMGSQGAAVYMSRFPGNRWRFEIP